MDGGSPDGDDASTGNGAADAGWGMPVDGGPPFSGPTTNGTVTVTPGTTIAQIGPGFAGLSYEKSHMQDGFFRGDNAALVALLRLLGPGVLRIGANAVDRTMWETAPVADAGATITKADVDGFAALIKAALPRSTAST